MWCAGDLGAVAAPVERPEGHALAALLAATLVVEAVAASEQQGPVSVQLPHRSRLNLKMKICALALFQPLLMSASLCEMSWTSDEILMNVVCLKVRCQQGADYRL